LPPTAEVTAEVSPARSYLELFRVTGPLLSLVFRTEDVWNQFRNVSEFSIRVSSSHFYNAGRAGLGWASGWSGGLGTLEELFCGNVIIHRARKAIQVDHCRPRRGSWLRFPWLSPIWNSFKLRGLHRHSYFGPRTCGRRRCVRCMQWLCCVSGVST
jgi:hypothetical protein